MREVSFFTGSKLLNMNNYSLFLAAFQTGEFDLQSVNYCPFGFLD